MAQNGASFTIKCAFCQNEHYSASCDVVKDVSKRRNILEKDNRCFNCLRRGHQVKECRNPKTCRHCSQRHHQSVCLLRDQERRDQEKSAQKEATPPEIKTTTTSVHSKSRGTVLLQTAQAMAVNNQNSANTNVRILLDTGSQRSYVTNRLKTKLNLSPVKSETLHLNTFGEESHKKQQCDVVNLHLQGAHGEIEVSALCFQKICSPVSAKINVDNYIHLQGLELADSSIVEELAHEEIVKKSPLIIHSLVSQSSERRRINKVIDCTRYSSKVRLLRVTATVLKVVKKWRHLDDNSTMQLNAVELNEAEQLWIKSIQAESFESELRNLEDSRLPSTQLVKQLGLFFDKHNSL